MELVQVQGLVIRSRNYGEADRILNIFTDKLGIVSVIAKGARKYKSHQAGATQLFSYAKFNLCPGKSMYTMRGASGVKNFYKLGENIEKLSLAQYFCELVYTFVSENMPDTEILRLILNALYVLSDRDRPQNLVKAAFEIKLAALSGYAMNTDECIKCGTADDVSLFSPLLGGLVCENCGILRPEAIKTGNSIRQAIKYIMSGDCSEIFSFEIGEKSAKQLCDIAEKYILSQAERDFKTLDYYKSIV